MDIILGLIVLASAVFGAVRGFARTITGIAQWLLALIAGVFLYGVLKTYLFDHTGIDEYINEKITTSMTMVLGQDPTYQAIPSLFKDSIDEVTGVFIYNTTKTMTDIIMTIVAFLSIIIAVKLVCFLIGLLFSKKYHHGLLGFTDGLLGFVFGVIRGGVLVLVFLAILVPVIGVLFPGLSETIMGSMDESYIAGYLYNNNVLLALTDGILK